MQSSATKDETPIATSLSQSNGKPTKVLVLNSNFVPINICSWRRAMILLFKQKAESLEKSCYIIHTRHVLPYVIRLHRYIPLPFNDIVLSRKNIFLRDNFKCQYCGKNGNLTIDHVIPRSRGGKDSWENVAVSCVRCNNRKGDKPLEESGLKLRSLPYRPPSNLYLHMTRLGSVPEVWYSYFFRTS